MTNRLESLSGNNKKSGSKPALKFKPKTVERKSKEERDKSVKIKSEESDKANRQKSVPLKKPRDRNKRYANTHVLSSGLLSSGAVSGNAQKETKIITVGGSSGGEFLQNLKLKNPEKSKLPSSEDSDEDDDITKIDMTKDYKFTDDETQLFPVRPVRNFGESQPSTFTKEPSPVKQEEFVKESSVKSENIETELQRILDSKADLESKIAQPVDLLNLEESEKASTDRANILSLINSKFNNPDDSFMLLQLPKVLPDYTLKPAFVKEEKLDDIDIEDVQEQTEVETKGAVAVEGQIGHINIHKSGKITINLGNDINLDLSSGAPSNFLQELALLDLSEQQEDQMEVDEETPVKAENNEDENYKGTISNLGEVDGKLIATPIITYI